MKIDNNKYIMQRILSTIVAVAMVFSLQAQQKEKWDVNNPPGNYKDVTLSLDEGTWMNLDVSPDGKTIAFDLLGDIYTMPIGGGKAKVLRSGLAYEVQPRFSPDGKYISFTSDAGGGDNIWVMDADGGHPRQVTQETFRLLNNAVWTPDGQYLIARKHFTSQRSIGAGEMFMYHISGGSGIQLTKRKNDQQDVNEPCISPDGRYVYFSEDMYPGGYFKYNKDPNKQIFVIKRYDREEGKEKTIVSGPGGGVRPQISHDGKKLAFVKRIREKSVLCVRDLDSGATYPLFDGLSKDQQEAWTVFGSYTGFSWLPGDKEMVIWGKGKLWRVDATTGEAKNIPFQVEAKHRLAETLTFQNPVFEDEFDVKVLRGLRTAPNGKYVVFNAVGYLWKMDLPNGEPARLTNDDNFEFEPAFSPDGKELAYVSWDDDKMGEVRVRNLATGATRTITDHKGIYRTPSFSPDGKMIVYKKDGGNAHQGYTHCVHQGIFTIDAQGKEEAKLVRESGDNPTFSVDGERIFYNTGGYLFGSLNKTFSSIKIDGTDNKVIFKAKHSNQFAPSPDNKWIAFTELYKVYIAPMPMPGKTIDLTAGTKAIPVAQVARDAGINLHWSADSKKVFWTLGNEYFDDELTQRFTFLEGAVDSIPPIDTVGIKIPLRMKTDKPEGIIAFTNARIITMEGDEVIENGTIIIENNVIKKIGNAKMRLPKGAKVYDATGKTIMPGIIDVHAHVGNFRYGLSPQKQWEYYANLAYGVTTSHDPSSNSEMIFSQSEMIKNGSMIGPRLYSTGVILYGAEGDFKAVINSLDDARSALRRTKAYGAFSVKSYNQPRREQRQQVIQAARELNMLVVPEGGSFFYHNMSMVVDGHTGVEHNIPVAPLQKDVTALWSKTKTHNTPTLIVNYGGVNGEYYWYQHTNVWEKERLLNFTPRAIVDSRARHRTMIPEEEYKNGHILTSESCTKLQESGVNINLGAHGQLQGLGAHWELWMLAQGGMSNHQALKCATINGAEYLGMEKEIGSLAKGKLADLIVIDGNPLENIQDSEKIEYVMINGRLYNPDTMNEIGNYDTKRTEFYFEKEGSGNAYPFNTTTNSIMPTQCSCRH